MTFQRLKWQNPIRKQGSLIGALFFCTLFLCSCASYQTKINRPYNYILSGQNDKALEILKPLAEQDSKDQLVYLLEYGIALHQAGRYKESSTVLLKANDIAEIKDYHSISKITASLILDESQVQYKGEDFEKVLINVYLAINYLMEGNLENAAVMARKVNEVLYKFKNEAKKDYAQNPFARYLNAIIWEADKNWDNTFIEYKNTYDLNPSFEMVKRDLAWAGIRARRPEELARLKKAFGAAVDYDKDRDKKEYGEVVLIYQQGQGPQKRPDPGFPRVPHLYARNTSGQRARVTVTSEDGKTTMFESEKVFSVTDTSLKTLNDEYGALIAKRAAGIATKAVVADQIAQKNRLLGAIAWIGLNAADQADLRQWATLPESFQIARKPLAPGKYKLIVEALNSSGSPTGERMVETSFEVKSQKKIFLTWRSFN